MSWKIYILLADVPEDWIAASPHHPSHSDQVLKQNDEGFHQGLFLGLVFVILYQAAVKKSRLRSTKYKYKAEISKQ